MKEQTFQAAFDAMCCVMFADGKASSEELSTLRDLLKRAKCPWDAAEVKSKLREFRDRVEAHGLDKIADETCELLRNQGGTLPQKSLTNCLDRIALSEGGIDIEERKLRHRFLQALQEAPSASPAPTNQSVPPPTPIPVANPPQLANPPQPGTGGNSAGCPNCSAAMNVGAIVCVACGYHTGLGQQLDTVVEAPETSLHAPRGITVVESGDSLVITEKGSPPPGAMFFLLSLSMFWLIGLLAAMFYRTLSRFGEPPAGALWLANLAWLPLVPIVYMFVAGFMNRTILEIAANRLTSKYGPLPWPQISTTLNTDNISHVYLVRRPTINPKRRRARPQGIAEHIEHEIAGPDPHADETIITDTYDVCAIVKSGWRKRLVCQDSYRKAEFFAAKTRERLGLDDVEIVSKWYQRLFRFETTVDDGEAIGEGPKNAISAKSMPISRSMITSICVLGMLVTLGMYGLRIFVRPQPPVVIPPVELPPKSYANRQAIENQPNDVDPAKRYAIEFDGSGYVVFPRSSYDGSHSLTLEARIKIGKTGSGHVISNLQRAGTSIGVLDEHLVFNVHNGQKYVQLKSVDRLTNQETHVAGVFDGKTLKIFINGKPAGMKSFSGRYRLSPFRFMIGANPENRKPPIDLFSGVIDEVRVSSTARYDGEFTPSVRFDSDEFTMALYHFDEGSGEIVNDSSGRGIQGKVAGAKWVETEVDGSE